MSKKTLVHGTKSPGWVKCPRCGWLLYGKRLARNLKVCPECGHHCRLSPRERIGQLTDPGTFTDHGRGLVAADVLEFVDRKPYRQRLDEAMAATGESEAAIYGTATISGNPVVIVAMNFAFMGGSMGVAVGEAVVQAADLARRRRTPLLLVTASGGARMQEGCLSLIQMARTSQAIGRLRAAGVLCVSLLTDPTFGGVTASFAMLGDVIIAESGALIGFAGPRVIAETIRQQLPDGFQTAEFLLRHGMVDRVESRAELRPLLALILSLHATKRGSLPAASGQPPIDDPEIIRERAADPWDVVRIARHIERPTTLDYIDAVFTDFCELHGDRTTGDDPAIVGGLARLGERTVMVIGHQKGHTTKELVARNFGMAHPEGYRKALRLMEHAAAFGLPVLTLVDTPGAFPGIEAEERGQSGAIAECIMRSAQLPVPVVSVVTGEGGSGGALALATADRVLMLERSFYSVISPEGCAAILWRTRDAAPEAARALGTTATDLLRLGIVDAVVPEPAEGAHTAAATVAGDLQRALVDSLHELTRWDPAALIDARHTRLRDMGSGTGGGVLVSVRSA